MQKTINIISDTTYGAKAHGVHTAFIQHKNFCEEELGYKVFVNKIFRAATIDHHHTLGLLYWVFMLVHFRRKHVVHAHVIFDTLVGSVKMPRLLHPLVKGYLRLVYRLADSVVAVSEDVKTDLVKKCLLEAEDVHVIQNLVLANKDAQKVTKHNARTKLGLDSRRKIILSIGQIQPRKRFDLFVKLAKDMPEVDFIWVGDTIFRIAGEGTREMDELKKSATNNVTLAGIVDNDKIPYYCRASDLFVLLSDNESGHPPMAVLEAMNYQLPVAVRERCFGKRPFGSSALAMQDETLTQQVEHLLNSPSKLQELSTYAEDFLIEKIITAAKLKYQKLYR